jgi:crotonobetainyl-CoA hydratase
VSVATRRDGRVLEVVLDRPKANAIDAATSRELGAIFSDFMSDGDLRVAILTGAGDRFFSAGWDLGAAAEGEAFESDYGPGGFGGFPELPSRPKPIIAAVNGLAVGGGFEIAMAADFLVAAEHAEFFLPEVLRGVIADAGTVRLPRLVPPHLAREMLLTGRRMDAAEAARWGIVHEVVPRERLMDAARALAARLCAAAPLSVAAVLEVMRATEALDTADAMTAMRRHAAYRACIDSLDAQEGPRAFAEKRDPVWQGR